MHSQEIVQSRSGSTHGIVRRHKSIVDKRIHEHTFAGHLAKITVLGDQITIIVVRHDNTIVLMGQLLETISKFVSQFIRFRK